MIFTINLPTLRLFDPGIVNNKTYSAANVRSDRQVEPFDKQWPMSKEQSPKPNQSFDFTERERLYEQISHNRFIALLEDKRTTLHEIDLSTNSFGEFLFVTVSQNQNTKHAITFWGLGYHEPRERRITNTWMWFESQRDVSTVRIAKATGLSQIEERRNDVLGWDTHEPPSKRAQLYTMLADLTDEDGALTELDDLSGFLDLDDN